MSRLHQVVFDWLDTVLATPSRPKSVSEVTLAWSLYYAGLNGDFCAAGGMSPMSANT